MTTTHGAQMVRPKKEDRTKVRSEILGIRIEEALKNQIDAAKSALAPGLDISRSQAARRLIELGLEQLPKKRGR